MDSSIIADIRYGYGVRSFQKKMATPDELIASLLNEDSTAAQFPVLDWKTAIKMDQSTKAAYKAYSTGKESKERYLSLHYQRERAGIEYCKMLIGRAMYGKSAFQERLTFFWSDHFAVSRNAGSRLRLLTPCFVNDAIRPNVTANFSEMLRAVTFHPAMLYYLNLFRSTGSKSLVGVIKNRTPNENFARELLELHTLGVDAGFTQSDVRSLANLLTGINIKGSKVSHDWLRFQPGRKKILGKTYESGFDEVNRFLDDIALRPQTAHHLATKLVQHFVSMDANENHVEEVAEAYLSSGGNLMKTYEAFLAHENAWSPLGDKVKQPLEFIVSALRTLGMTQGEFLALNHDELRALIMDPLEAMGQPFLSPAAPDGWSEHNEKWITPDAYATRVQWSFDNSRDRGAQIVPLDAAYRSLGSYLSSELEWAIKAAPSTSESLALLLSSPEFNRR